MNLSKLFEEQKPLRNKILKKFDLVDDVGLLENFIVAFQAELYELANEWRGFKHWSTDQEMRRDKALEEFADCMAFLLELGLELDLLKEWHVDDLVIQKESTIQLQFLEFNKYLHCRFNETSWFSIAELLFGLGEMLGFTEKEMITAYYDKNKINHERQENGY